MDEACVRGECSGVAWLRNVIKFVDNKYLPFHLIVKEVDNNNNKSFGNVLNFTECSPLKLQVIIIIQMN